MWHASGCGSSLAISKALARGALRGVGDARLGQWEEEGRRGVWHVQRRLTDRERFLFGVPAPIDIRGTELELERIESVFREAPGLRGRI